MAANSTYQALGVRAGGFIISPSFESENEWNDNIYATQENEVSDFIFHIKPQLNINSNWNNHSLELIVGSNIAFYASNSSEEKQDYFVNLLGRLDVVKGSFATAEFSYKNHTEDRGSPDSFISSTEPVEYETLGGKVGYEHKINRLRINASHELKHLSYNDTQSTLGNTLQNSARNHYANNSQIRVGYELFTGYEAYLQGTYSFIDYENVFTDQGNLDRSSDGFNVAAGVKIELTQLLLADGHIGYQERSYDAGGTTSGISGGLGLEWLATRLTTVSLDLNRDIEETALANASGRYSTSAVLSVDHKLKRNILLNGYAGYTYNDYKGGLDREEDLYRAGINLKYSINRNLYLKTGYSYKGRATNLNNSDYDSNSVFFTLGAQL